MTDPIRIVIVDDHPIVRRGLTDFLGTAEDLLVVGQAANGVEAVTVVGRERPDLVLMDLSMPGGDGVTATRRITELYPEVLVIVLTSFADEATVVRALDAGAIGYLLKHNEPAELLEGIRSAMVGGSPLDRTVARTLLQTRLKRADSVELSGREREVLLLVASGLPNKRIASQLGIGERTVKAHLSHIYQRLHVPDRTQAALWARDNLT
jgi:DNA-binding NarL/FixJ family response regulator